MYTISAIMSNFPPCKQSGKGYVAEIQCSALFSNMSVLVPAGRGWGWSASVILINAFKVFTATETAETANRTLICPVSVFQDVLENMNVLSKEGLEPTH